MLTEAALKDKIYLLLRAKNLHSAISGRIYKEPRPANSQLVDVEISVLSSMNGQVQDFTVNVNVFVPDVPRGDEMIEDTTSIRSLSSTFATALESVVEDGYHVSLASQHVYKVNDRDIHVINNRLDIDYCNS